MTLQLRAQAFASILNTRGMITVSRKSLVKIVAVIFLVYVAVTVMTLISTFRASESISRTNLGSTLASGDTGLEELEQKLAVFDRRFSLLKFWLLPARYTSRVVILFPPLDRQREAAELLLERVEIGSSTAELAIELGRSSFGLRDDALSGSVSLSDPDQLVDLSDSLAALKFDSIQVLDSLERSSAVKTEFEDLPANRFFESLSRRMNGQEEQLAEIARFSGLLSDVLVHDITMIQEMTGTFDELRSFATGEASTTEIEAVIVDLARRTAAIKRMSTEMVESAPEAVISTGYGDVIGTLHELNVVADRLAGSLLMIVGVFADSFDRLAASEKSLFDDGEALSETLNSLIENEEEIASAVDSISNNVSLLLELGESGPISLGALGDVLERRVEPLLELSSMMIGAPRVAGEVFGVDGETRRFLFLGQTSDELRAAGGFTSSSWILTFRAGMLVDREYLEVAHFEDLDSLDQYPDAYDALRLHMDAGSMFLRDAGWDPNFPTVGKLALEIYAIGRDVEVDGVISLTQWAFIEFISAMNGLKTDSGVIQAEDLLSTIEEGTDREGTIFLSTLFDVLIDSMNGETLKANGINVLTSTESLFGSKDLMIYTQTSEIQSQIVKIGWCGPLSNSRGDRLAVVDSNVGWNKVDRNIDRKFSYQVDLSDVKTPRAKLELEYANLSVIADNICDVQKHVGGQYEILLDGCYWNYVRVYLPLGAELVSGDSLPLEPGSIAVRVGGQVAGRDTVGLTYDDNGVHISGLMAVNPQEVRTVTFNYLLPRQVLRFESDAFEYTLDVVVQGGTRGREGVVSVILPDDYELIEAPNSVRVSPNLVEIAVNPERDDVIRLVLRESS